MNSKYSLITGFTDIADWRYFMSPKNTSIYILPEFPIGMLGANKLCIPPFCLARFSAKELLAFGALKFCKRPIHNLATFITLNFFPRSTAHILAFGRAINPIAALQPERLNMERDSTLLT